MFRESDEFDGELVKEMAEGLGSQGIKLETLLEKIELMSDVIDRISRNDEPPPTYKGPTILANAVKEHNDLVDQARDALRWLLIQREACGFRRHKNVDIYYPIPEKVQITEQ